MISTIIWKFQRQALWIIFYYNNLCFFFILKIQILTNGESVLILWAKKHVVQRTRPKRIKFYENWDYLKIIYFANL